HRGDRRGAQDSRHLRHQDSEQQQLNRTCAYGWESGRLAEIRNLLEHRLRRRNSARGAKDFDSENQRVAFLDPSAGLTVGVAIRRRHCDTDGGPDLLSGDRLLKARHDSVEPELSWAAAFVGAVEHTAVTDIDAH